MKILKNKPKTTPKQDNPKQKHTKNLTTPEKKREYSMLSYLVKTKASETINQTRNQTRENQSSETKPTPSQNQNKPANLQ